MLTYDDFVAGFSEELKTKLSEHNIKCRTLITAFGLLLRISSGDLVPQQLTWRNFEGLNLKGCRITTASRSWIIKGHRCHLAMKEDFTISLINNCDNRISMVDGVLTWHIQASPGRILPKYHLHWLWFNLRIKKELVNDLINVYIKLVKSTLNTI